MEPLSPEEIEQMRGDLRTVTVPPIHPRWDVRRIVFTLDLLQQQLDAIQTDPALPIVQALQALTGAMSGEEQFNAVMAASLRDPELRHLFRLAYKLMRVVYSLLDLDEATRQVPPEVS